MTDSSSVLQMVVINMEDEVEDKRPDEREQTYHFAMSGRAFAVITEHFPQLVQKVPTRLTPLVSRKIKVSK